MREIKFITYVEYGDGSTYMSEPYTLDDAFTMQPGIEPPMGIVKRLYRQYTGLKDKNGKGVEVYEGDIINNHPKIKPQVVIFKNGMFGVQAGDKFFSLYALLGNHRVIGNIYENPELLQDL